MAFDADPSATHDPSAGADPPAAWGDILNANWEYLAGTWETYTPSWTASTDPAIGNGTLTGRFLKMGKLGIITVYLEMGSTTTFGSGAWTIGLPSGWTTAATIKQYVPATARDGTQQYNAVWNLDASVTGAGLRAHGGTSSFADTVPFTWASGDFLLIPPTPLFLA